jgi:hypothetical protein
MSAPEQDIVDRLRIRASIRRNIQTRKSVQEGKPDRIANLLDDAADEIEEIRVWRNFYLIISVFLLTVLVFVS